MRDYKVIVAKVVLLPCPTDPTRLFGHHEVPNLALYGPDAGVAADVAYLSPRRFTKHVELVRRFVDDGVQTAVAGYLYMARK